MKPIFLLSNLPQYFCNSNLLIIVIIVSEPFNPSIIVFSKNFKSLYCGYNFFWFLFATLFRNPSREKNRGLFRAFAHYFPSTWPKKRLSRGIRRKIIFSTKRSHSRMHPLPAEPRPFDYVGANLFEGGGVPPHLLPSFFSSDCEGRSHMGITHSPSFCCALHLRSPPALKLCSLLPQVFMGDIQGVFASHNVSVDPQPAAHCFEKSQLNVKDGYGVHILVANWRPTLLDNKCTGFPPESKLRCLISFSLRCVRKNTHIWVCALVCPKFLNTCMVRRFSIYHNDVLILVSNPAKNLYIFYKILSYLCFVLF